MARVRLRMRPVNVSARQKMKARLSNTNARAERAGVFFHGGPAGKRLGKEAIFFQRP